MPKVHYLKLCANWNCLLMSAILIRQNLIQWTKRPSLYKSCCLAFITPITVHRSEIRQGAAERLVCGRRFRGPRHRHGAADEQLQRPADEHLRHLPSAAEHLRHGLAGSCRRGLQHSRGRTDHPYLPGRELPDGADEDDADGEHRPVELLALRLHRCCRVFREG